MQRIYALLAVLAVLVIGTPVQALAEDPEAILKAIQEKYADLNSLTADYTRVTNTPAMEGLFKTGSKHTAGGLLQFRKPAKLILNQASPRTEKLVTDGRTVWWYIPDENLVHRYADQDIYGELKPLLDFLGGLGGLEGRFAVKIVPAGTQNETKHRLELNRLQQGSGPAGITVWVEPDTLQLAAFRLTTVMGETTDFTLSNVRINPELDDALFIFRIPDGVQVLEEQGSKS